MRTVALDTDGTVYPESDEMGEHEIQTWITELLRPLVEQWLRDHARIAHAGADQFFYWVPGRTDISRAPDVYLIEGLAQDIPARGVWKVWEGHRPTFALEVCGDRWQKDYDDAPADYDTMGTTELVIFDPGATSRSRRRVRWQTFRRTTDGRLRRVSHTMGDRVQSNVLGCWLRAVEERSKPRLRLATGWRGQTLVPTPGEMVGAAQAAEARERAAREAAEVAREAAEREIAQLRTELANYRKG